MSILAKSFATVSILGIFAGCTSEGFTSRVVTGANALNIGTEDATESASGLPFASVTQTAADLEGRYPLIVRLVRFETDWETGVSGVVVTDEQLVLNFDPGEDFRSSITFNGRTYDLGTDGSAVLSNGQDLFVDTYEDLTSERVGIFNVYTYSPDGISGFDADGFVVIGLQTDPASLSGLGQTTYEGNLEGYGNLFDETNTLVDGSTLFDGLVEVDVDFDGGNILSTEVVIDLLDLENAPLLYLSGDGGQIIGNGFADDMTFYTCSSGSTCAGNVLIGGAFFGENAEELAGNLAVDVTQTDDTSGEGIRLIGAGAFVAGPAAP